MKNLLIVFATHTEAAEIINNLSIPRIAAEQEIYRKQIKNIAVSVLIAGVGTVNTVYNLQEYLCNNNVDFAINAGIAGTYFDSLSLGDLTLVKTEQFGNFGVNSNGTKKTAFDAGLADGNKFPFEDGMLINRTNVPENNFKLFISDGVTVDLIGIPEGNLIDFDKLTNRVVESMEGAAFFYVCLKRKINFMELRAISNIVNSTNRAEWNIKLAIKNLGNILCQIILLFD